MTTKKTPPKKMTADQWIDRMLGTEPKARQRNTALTFIVALLLLFVIANSGYLIKRFNQLVFPAIREAAPHKAIDDIHLLSLSGTPNRILIPNIEITAPIINVTERNEKAYQEALKNGVAHFPGTAAPGKHGNTYLFGHSSDSPLSSGDYKTVFATLPDIQIGDPIYLTDAQGNAFRYLTISTDIIKPNDLSVLDQYENQKRMLTVQTSYPLGTALRRFIVIAEFDAEILVR